MKILYYLDYFPKLSESFILNEIYYLTQQGHNVAVFSLNKSETDLGHEELDEVDVDLSYADQPSPMSISRVLGESMLDRDVPYDTKFPNLRQRVGARFLTKQCLDFVNTLEYEIDHVHSHFARWNKIPAAIVAKTIDASSSVTTHAYDLYASRDEDVLKKTCDAFDSVFTISEYNKQFIEVEIEPDAKVELVRMGIRTEKFEPTETTDEQRLLTIARFVEKKGIEYALHAVAECVDKYPDIDYRLIGSGPRKDRYDRIIAERGIEENVTFLGTVSDKELIDELDRAKAFLLPCVVAKNGDRDGIPVVLMEAMAMETPPITTNVSGIPELVNTDVNGFLCGERSIDDLVRTLDRILAEYEASPSIGENARESIQLRFETDVVCADFESVIQ